MEEQVVSCPLTRGKKILVAVDGSEYSYAAVEQAAMLGNMCNSKIYLVSVVDLLPEQYQLVPDLVENLSKEVQEHLNKAQEKISNAGLSSETIVHSGNRAYKFIVREAREKEVDLIVMGTHGRTGFKKYLLGSVAQNVLGNAPCPVLVIPALKLEDQKNV